MSMWLTNHMARPCSHHRLLSTCFTCFCRRSSYIVLRVHWVRVRHGLGKDVWFLYAFVPSCSCARISLRSSLGIKNLLSFEDNSIFNWQFMAIVPEFTQIVWFFVDCGWRTSEDDLTQTAKSRQFRNRQFRV